jgi:hypothetical protein
MGRYVGLWILVLCFCFGGGWSSGEAEAAAGVAGEVSAVFSIQRNHSEVFYHGTNGLINYSYVSGNRWHHHPLTQGGKVTGAISAVYSLHRRHSEVFYRGADGYLHYLFVEGGWKHDGTSFRVGGKIAGAISAVYSVHRNHSEVFFRGEDGYIHYFYIHANRWTHHAMREMGVVRGGLSAQYDLVARHSALFFQGEGDQLYSLHVVHGKGWVREKIAFSSFGAYRIQGGLVAVHSGRPRAVAAVFQNQDGRVVYAYFDLKEPRLDGISRKDPSSGSSLSAAFSLARSHPEVFYRGKDNGLRFLYVARGQKPQKMVRGGKPQPHGKIVRMPKTNREYRWRHDADSLRIAGPVGGAISAVYANNRSHSEAFFRGADGRLRYVYVSSGKWHAHRF